MLIHDSQLPILFTVIVFVATFGRSQASDKSTPRYMIELYERYKNDQTTLTKKSITTVRSILPMKGKMEGGEMLVYNLTGVPRTEVIIRAELHAYIRKRKPKNHTFTITLWDLMLTSSPPLEEHRISDEVGWKVYDFTEAVLSCRTENGENQNLLGVSVQVNSERRKQRPLPVRRLIGSNPQPFLVLFSDDEAVDSSNTTDAFQSRLDNIVKNYVQNSRIKRSVHDNKLPEYPAYHVNGLPLMPSSVGYGKSTRLLHKGNTTGSKKQRGRKDKKKRKHRKLPFLKGKWNSHHENDATIVDDDEVGIGTCQKKKLIIDFAEIGWIEWVIAPKYFEADYCSGQCPFPLTKNMLPTNHATLQSLVHALNLDPNVPPPCCVPEFTSSLTLLYFDDSDNVVLKSYPNMAVESCACR